LHQVVGQIRIDFSPVAHKVRCDLGAERRRVTSAISNRIFPLTLALALFHPGVESPCKDDRASRDPLPVV